MKFYSNYKQKKNFYILFLLSSVLFLLSNCKSDPTTRQTIAILNINGTRLELNGQDYTSTIIPDTTDTDKVFQIDSGFTVKFELNDDFAREKEIEWVVDGVSIQKGNELIFEYPANKIGINKIELKVIDKTPLMAYLFVKENKKPKHLQAPTLPSERPITVVGSPPIAKPKEITFNENIQKGDESVRNDSLDIALIHYKNALNTNVDNATATRKINETNKAISSRKDPKVQTNRSEFDDFIQNGDKSLRAGKFDEAIAYYDKALATNIDNSVANLKKIEAQRRRDLPPFDQRKTMCKIGSLDEVTEQNITMKKGFILIKPQRDIKLYEAKLAATEDGTINFSLGGGRLENDISIGKKVNKGSTTIRFNDFSHTILSSGETYYLRYECLGDVHVYSIKKAFSAGTTNADVIIEGINIILFDVIYQYQK